MMPGGVRRRQRAGRRWSASFATRTSGGRGGASYPPPTMANSAAFFDLDKTLMAGSSGMVFARVANQRGFVPRRQLARWGWDHLRYRLRGSSDEQTNEVLDEVYRHQDEGRATFIVSAAGNDLVKALAAVLGMEGGIGTRCQIGADGTCTGEMDGPFVYGKGKVEAMRRFAERHDIDMDASYAYSDSVSDLPMLRSVGQAVVVNPDADLLEIARQEGWQVMRFEKLGRKLAIAGATMLAAAAGGIGALASRRRQSTGLRSARGVRWR